MADRPNYTAAHLRTINRDRAEKIKASIEGLELPVRQLIADLKTIGEDWFDADDLRLCLIGAKQYASQTLDKLDEQQNPRAKVSGQ